MALSHAHCITRRSPQGQRYRSAADDAVAQHSDQLDGKEPRAMGLRFTNHYVATSVNTLLIMSTINECTSRIKGTEHIRTTK